MRAEPHQPQRTELGGADVTPGREGRLGPVGEGLSCVGELGLQRGVGAHGSCSHLGLQHLATRCAQLLSALRGRNTTVVEARGRGAAQVAVTVPHVRGVYRRV